MVVFYNGRKKRSRELVSKTEILEQPQEEPYCFRTGTGMLQGYLRLKPVTLAEAVTVRGELSPFSI
jgi:hypothetical protein